jgi:hypothetical protein
MIRTRPLVATVSAGLLTLVLASVQTPAGDAAPAALRDGRIVFLNQATSQIETINPDGSARQLVTPATTDSNDAPRWSPDGSRIVYTSAHPGGDGRVFTIRPDGSGIHQVVGETSGWGDAAPTYTPDGAWVVYTRCRPDPPGGCALFRVHPDGTGRRPVTTFGQRGDFYVDVSPDGKRIAFARYGERGIKIQVWVARLDGSDAHPVTKPALEAGTVRWTADSDHLLVTDHFYHLGENVWRLRADGSHLTRLTSRGYPGTAEWPESSPSGAHVVYSDDQAYAPGQGFDLRVIDQGGGRHAITHDGSLVEPDWGTAALQKPSASSTVARAPVHKSAASDPAQRWLLGAGTTRR